MTFLKINYTFYLVKLEIKSIKHNFKKTYTKHENVYILAQAHFSRNHFA